MPVITYLTDNEIERCRKVTSCDELNDLLQAVRVLSGEDWLIEERVRRTSWWRKLFLGEDDTSYMYYTLYYVMPFGGEVQIINLRTTNDGGTVFGTDGHEKAHISNYLMGYKNGLQKGAQVVG